MTEDLTALREAIEYVDDALIDILAHRAALVARVWAHKDAVGLARFDADREAAEIARLVERAVAAGLDGDAVREVLSTVVGRSFSTGGEA